MAGPADPRRPGSAALSAAAGRKERIDRLTDEEAGWLEEVKNPPPPKAPHVCGRCKTPFGRSALPCPNDPDHDPLEALRVRLGTSERNAT